MNKAKAKITALKLISSNELVIFEHCGLGDDYTEKEKEKVAKEMHAFFYSLRNRIEKLEANQRGELHLNL